MSPGHPRAASQSHQLSKQEPTAPKNTRQFAGRANSSERPKTIPVPGSSQLLNKKNEANKIHCSGSCVKHLALLQFHHSAEPCGNRHMGHTSINCSNCGRCCSCCKQTHCHSPRPNPYTNLVGTISANAAVTVTFWQSSATRNEIFILHAWYPMTFASFVQCTT